MSSKSREPRPIDPAPERIAIYRSTEIGRVFAEKVARLAEEIMFNLEGAIGAAEQAVRAGEMSEDIVSELRDIHALVRQRALGTSPQGRLV
jgi:hypothetical protein